MRMTSEISIHALTMIFTIKQETRCCRPSSRSASGSRRRILFSDQPNVQMMAPSGQFSQPRPSLKIGLKLRRHSTPPPSGAGVPFRCVCADWRQSPSTRFKSSEALHLENSMTVQIGYAFQQVSPLRAKGSNTPLTDQGQERIWKERHPLSRLRPHEDAALPFINKELHLYEQSSFSPCVH